MRDALIALIHEKPYESIAVKEILDRANVGRSTFYTHFRDKDDLLVGGIYDVVHAAKSAALRGSGPWYERILWFSQPIFEYRSSRPHQHEARFSAGSRARAIHHERLNEALCDMIGDDVRAEFEKRPLAKTAPPDLVTRYLASTFVIVLVWWAASKAPLAPKEIDDVFRSLVLPTLSALR